MHTTLSRLFKVVTIGAAASLNACGAGDTTSTTGAGAESSRFGTVDLDLQVAPGITLNSFTYTITGPGGFTRTGSVDVSGSSTLSTQVSTLPPGSGYDVAISSTSTDGGTSWTPDAANGWGAGKLLHYTSGTGAPDSEGLTRAEWTDSSMYVSTERDNNVSGTSRLSILRFDTNAATPELTALNDWNVTADLPVVGANLGLEAITYVPDTALVAGGFIDDATHAPYNPAVYPNHGTGIFFVGVEGNGFVYAYALDHVTNAFTRIATFSSGQPAIMDLAYDRDVGYLWGYCDNTCGNKATVFRLDTTAMSPTLGHFAIGRVFDHPSTLPNSNNEGITFAPESQCSGGQKAFFWTDDDQINGHALRRGSVSCGAFF